MKKIIITICLFTGIISFSNAQGNLQFNRVVNIKYTTLLIENPATGYRDQFKDTTLTIPNNKVWKIESVSISQCGDTNVSLNSNIKFVPLGSSIYFAAMLNGTPIGSPIFGDQPQSFANNSVWLASNSVNSIGVRQLNSTGGSYFVRIFLTAIEYNIVP